MDGAIHDAASPGLLVQCRQGGGCPTGQARLTGGYQLPAHFISHTVGPFYRGGDRGEANLLRSYYRESLRLAAGRRLATVAFPCISTRIYGYPKREACAVAVSAVRAWLNANAWPREVTFC